MRKSQVIRLLEEVGRKLGFEVAHDPQKESRINRLLDDLARLDVVWYKELPEPLGKVIIAAFEVIDKAISVKELKGNFFNLQHASCGIGVIVAPLRDLREGRVKVPSIWQSYFKSGRFERELNALAKATAITSNIKIMDYSDVNDLAKRLGIEIVNEN